MLRASFLSLIVVALISCDQQPQSPIDSGAKSAIEASKATPVPASTPSATPAPAAKAPASAPDPTAIAGQVKATADTALADAQKTAGKAAESIAVPASAAELEKKIGTFNIDQLKTLADKLVTELNKNEALKKTLADQIAKVGLDPTKIGDLKTKLDSATKTLADLKAQLTAVADKLKAGNIEVSKYTAFLGGK